MSFANLLRGIATHSERRIAFFLGLLLLPLLSNPARGDFLYQFTTTMSAGDGGVLSVNFVVPDAAVARGAVLPSDVTSYIGPALIDEPTVPFLFRYA
jgi:hypothetical protein